MDVLATEPAPRFPPVGSSFDEQEEKKATVNATTAEPVRHDDDTVTESFDE